MQDFKQVSFEFQGKEYNADIFFTLQTDPETKLQDFEYEVSGVWCDEPATDRELKNALDELESEESLVKQLIMS